jgi:L-iditol 2-dehydrogenase
MKAMVLQAADEVAPKDIRRPEAESGGTLVRVTHSGICGTDVKIFHNDIKVRHPLVMGHEMIGDAMEGKSTGPRVIVDPVYYCGRCYLCSHGQMHLCTNGGLFGRDRDGGFAEYFAAPPGSVYELPDDIAGEAPLIQVLTTCLHGHRLAQIFAGESVVVTGLGVTGQLHIQLAKAFGAGKVIGITRSAWKRELAEQLGADLTLAPGDDLIERVRDATEGRGADLVIETAAKMTTLADAIHMARTGGRLMLFGIYTETEGKLPFYDFYLKELNLINTRAAQPKDYPASIDLVRRGAVKLAPLITHTLPLDELDSALAMLDSGAGRQMKILLDHG